MIVFVTVIEGRQRTVSDALAFDGAVPLVSVALAVLSYFLQTAPTVLLSTCTLALAPEASVVAARESTPALIAQLPTAAGDDEIDQLIPAPVGSGSLTVTPVAVPGPLFVTVTRKPIF